MKHREILVNVYPNKLAKILNAVGPNSNLLPIDNKEMQKIIRKIPKNYVGVVNLYCGVVENHYLCWDWYDPPFIDEEWFINDVNTLNRNFLSKGPLNGCVVASFEYNKGEVSKTMSIYNYRLLLYTRAPKDWKYITVGERKIYDLGR